MLQLQGVEQRYPGAATLRFPDLRADAGEVLVLRGASGSGKSTLLALVAGLLTPSAGQVRVGGVDVGALPPRQRDAWRAAQLGFVPQRLHLSDALSVRDNLALPYLAAGEPVDAARRDALLEQLGLAALAARRPHALSVGQAQRVSVARALLRRPALLLADEPTASLDDEQADNVLTLLAGLCAEAGTTLLLATHDGRVETRWPQAAVWRLGRPPSAATAAAA